MADIHHALARWAIVVMITTVWLAPSADARRPMRIESWAYQLQNYDHEALAELGVDLLVVDADELRRHHLPLAPLKKGNRWVVSYLSIGEAEVYRGYWQSAWAQSPPAWLGPENPHWKGNFKVKYWHGEWQRLMRDAVARLAKEGFDGAYLDIVDAWEFWDRHGVDDARERMEEFVIDLAKTARRINPEFRIIAQNAPELASTDRYLDTIDAQAIEDLWFDGDHRQSPVDVRWTLNQLDAVIDAGKPVLSIDYVTRFHTVADYCRRGRAHGLVPFTAPRALDAIPTTAHRQCPGPAVRVAGP